MGLCKTFEALAIIKYYELRNCKVLVLALKKLHDNWLVYRVDDNRNILASDRFSYGLLNHTYLSRKDGISADKYVLPHKRNYYIKLHDTKFKGGKSVLKQIDQEQSIIYLMKTTPLKMIESYINSFTLTLEILHILSYNKSMFYIIKK